MQAANWTLKPAPSSLSTPPISLSRCAQRCAALQPRHRPAVRPVAAPAGIRSAVVAPRQCLVPRCASPPPRPGLRPSSASTAWLSSSWISRPRSPRTLRGRPGSGISTSSASPGRGAAASASAKSCSNSSSPKAAGSSDSVPRSMARESSVVSSSRRCRRCCDAVARPVRAGGWTGPTGRAGRSPGSARPGLRAVQARGRAAGSCARWMERAARPAQAVTTVAQAPVGRRCRAEGFGPAPTQHPRHRHRHRGQQQQPQCHAPAPASRRWRSPSRCAGGGQDKSEHRPCGS